MKKEDEHKSRLYLEKKRFKRECSECGMRKKVAYCFYTEQIPSFLKSPILQHFVCQNCGIELLRNKEIMMSEDAKNMEDVMINIPLDSSAETVMEVMEQAGYVYKGEFRYSVELGLVITELFEKENRLFYFAGISQCRENDISVINIGDAENKSSTAKNAETIFLVNER